MKRLITGIAVKALLTEDELVACKEIGLYRDSHWSTAVFTGSRAFGTNRDDSDIDIFFSTGAILDRYTTFDGDHDLVELPGNWKHKNPILGVNEDYSQSDINIANGRLNIFTLEDGPIRSPWNMYLDATELCVKINGNKEIFKAFVGIVTEREFYE